MAKSRRPESRSSYHHGNLRAALLSAGMRLLRKNGPTALSLRGVARAAGVSQTAPYKHFSDKAALLAALAEEGFRELSGRFETAAEGVGEPRNRLQRIGQAYVQFALDDPSLYQLMFSAELSDVRKPQANLIAAGQRTYGVLEHAVAAVLPASDEIRVACVSAWSLVHGLSLLLLHGRIEVDKRGRAALIEQVTSLFAETLGKSAQ
jgi:AcrR family transcriptional regulator